MNGHTMEILKRCARESKAIEPCSLCGVYNVLAFDDDTERQTYAFGLVPMAVVSLVV